MNRKRKDNGGWTLLEILIGLTIFTVLLVMVGSSVVSQQKTLALTEQSLLQTQVADRVAQLLADQRLVEPRTGIVIVRKDGIFLDKAPAEIDSSPGKPTKRKIQETRLRYIASSQDLDENVTAVYVTLYPENLKQNEIPTKSCVAYLKEPGK